MKYPKFTAALMSGALALSIGLVGCGGGSQSTAASTAESTTAETSATSTTTESSSTTTESSSTTSPTSEASQTWTNCYMGVSESGENFFYAENQSDTQNPQGLMIVLNPETEQYISFVGPLSNPSETQVTIEDTSTGNTITFEVEAAEDGGLLVDLGDTGKAVLVECTAGDIDNAIEIIDTYGEALA